MDNSKNKRFLLSNGIKCILKWARRSVFIVFAAFMIGFANAFNNEDRWINDISNINKQEQVIDDDTIK